MTWIRFGRNEPRAPSLSMRSNRSETLDLHDFRHDGTLLLFFAPPDGISSCGELLAALRAAPLHEQEAELLVVTRQEPDVAGYQDVTIAYDPQSRLRGEYADLMAADSAGKPMLFVLDRDGAPVYAWVAACDDWQSVTSELQRKLQSASFLCPECSVPDPTSVAMWDVVY